jgi:Flp pilus assembly protein TadG
MKNKTDLLDCRRQRLIKLIRRAPEDSGQAIVELALTLPLLFLLLFGAFELGRLAYAAIEVSNAAHAGVQYGSQSRSTANDDANMKQAALNDGSNITSMSATSQHFCTCSNGSASTCSPTDCSSSRIIEYVQVNTSAVVHPLFSVPGLPKTFTFRGQAIMRLAQ